VNNAFVEPFRIKTSFAAYDLRYGARFKERRNLRILKDR
jgi:hypothetical protein